MAIAFFSPDFVVVLPFLMYDTPVSIVAPIPIVKSNNAVFILIPPKNKI